MKFERSARQVDYRLTSSLGGLDVGEGNAVGNNRGPVDVGLVSRDIDTLWLSFDLEVPRSLISDAEDGNGEEECRCESFEVGQHCYRVWYSHRDSLLFYTKTMNWVYFLSAACQARSNNTSVLIWWVLCNAAFTQCIGWGKRGRSCHT